MDQPDVETRLQRNQCCCYTVLLPSDMRSCWAGASEDWSSESTLVSRTAAEKHLASVADYDLTTPWYTFFILERDGGKPGYFVPNIKSAVTFPVGLASAVFLLLSAIDHLAVSLPGLNSIYNRNLGRGLNYFRWIEYSGAVATLSLHLVPCRPQGHAQLSRYQCTARCVIWGRSSDSFCAR